MQLRKIVLVQACVRRWLARSRYQLAKWQMARSVMTLQRYTRGWLARRHYQEQRRIAEQRRQEEEARSAKGL
jgi:myosin-3